MASEIEPEPNVSATTLVSGIIADAQDLLKQQFNLFKQEVREDIRKMKDAGLMVGVGIGFGLVGAMLVGTMFAHLLAWLEPALPLWACYGICGGVVLAVGVVLGYVGMAKFASFNPLEDETAQSLKENVQWLTNPK